MTRENITISVVIPTLGRSCVAAAVDSVLRQTYIPQEIIVIDASTDGSAKNFLPSHPNILVIRPDAVQENGFWTAAHNRNIGIKAASSDYVALLDDDDEWRSNKLEKQVAAALKNPHFVISCCGESRTKNNRSYRRPRKCLAPDQDFLSALYGNSRFLPLPRYVATPSLLVPSFIAKNVPIREDLLGFEDTWWLHEIQSSGYSILQLDEDLIVVNAEPIRSISRDTLEKNSSWASHLATVDKLYAQNYLTGIAIRNAMILGRSTEIKALLNEAKLYGSVGFGVLSKIAIAYFFSLLRATR
jgi:glycosyltransferase involved in cell wall biosynthesis